MWVTQFSKIFLQDEKVPPVSFFKVMRFNISEWPYILVGTICAVINGAMQPVFSIIFTEIIVVGCPRRRLSSCALSFSAANDAFHFCWFQVFTETDKEIIRGKSSFFCILFAVMGLITFFTMFLQVCAQKPIFLLRARSFTFLKNLSSNWVLKSFRRALIMFVRSEVNPIRLSVSAEEIMDVYVQAEHSVCVFDKHWVFI